MVMDPYRFTQLNPHTRNSSVEDWDTDAGDNLFRIKRAINDYYKNASIKTHDGTWRAICLFSTIVHYEDGSYPESALSINLNNSVNVVEVVARVPELDLLRPWPSNFGDSDELSAQDEDWLMMHRVFRKQIIGGADSPSPGDIIEVDFEDRISREGNIYLGILEKGLGTIPDREPDNTEGAQDAFND